MKQKRGQILGTIPSNPARNSRSSQSARFGSGPLKCFSKEDLVFDGISHASEESMIPVRISRQSSSQCFSRKQNAWKINDAKFASKFPRRSSFKAKSKCTYNALFSWKISIYPISGVAYMHIVDLLSSGDDALGPIYE